MGITPCCSKVGLNRGTWTAREDKLLIHYINSNGEGHWSSLPKNAGLLRCGKSCRLRWMNYLRPDIKRGNITPDEEDLILRLQALLGNRWSLIAGRLPGRTDNEIKNYWNTHLSRRLKNRTTGKGTEKQSSTRKRASKPQCVPSESKKNDRGNICADDGRVEEEETTMTKIHIPKAIRVSPFSTQIASFHGGQGDQKQEQEDGCHVSEVSNLHVSWFEEISKNDWEALVCDSVRDYDFASQSSEIAAATVTTMIPLNIREEYQQLIKPQEHDHLESFVDSLLI